VDRAAEPSTSRPLAPMIPATLALVEIPIDSKPTASPAPSRVIVHSSEGAFCVLRGQDPVQGQQAGQGAGVGVYRRGHPTGGAA
jgi:hypothetical protein